MIVIVAPRPAGPRRAGQTSVEFYAEAVADGLAAHGPVYLVSPAGASATRRLRSAWQPGTAGRWQPVARPGPGGLRLLQFVRQLQPSLVQIENRPRWALTLRQLGYRGPLVLSLHSLNFLRPSCLRPPLARRCLDAADAIVCNSLYTKRQLLRRFHPVASRVHRIYGGVDCRLFRPNAGEAALLEAREAMRRHWGAGERPVVLFAGRMIRQKGLHVVLRALARQQAPGALLVAVGWPRPRPEHRGYAGRVWRLARRLGVAARFPGRVPHRLMPLVYRAADVFVFPSQGREALGLANVEAMACGLPVIASHSSGIREVIRPGRDGWLMPDFQSPAAWRRALAEMLARPAAAAQLGAAARQRACRHFTWARTVARLRRLYRRLGVPQRYGAGNRATAPVGQPGRAPGHG